MNKEKEQEKFTKLYSPTKKWFKSKQTEQKRRRLRWVFSVAQANTLTFK